MKISTKQFVTCGISLLAFAHISSAYADSCSVKSLAGEWAFSEQGATKLAANPSVPFSEVGWFQINVSNNSSIGTGNGQAFVSVNGDPLIGRGPDGAITITIQNMQVDANCMGFATFSANNLPRTITFTLFSSKKFQYISTSGDITTLGTAEKR